MMLGISYSVYSSYKFDTKNWHKTIGVVEYRTYGRNGSRMFAFSVNGKIIKDARGGKGYPGECVGDIYEILYNPDDYSEIKVLEHRPVFLKNETVGITIGIVTGYTKATPYNKEYLRIAPEYKYYVNGKKYIRSQVILLPIKLGLSVKKGMEFNVRYWLTNPQRSILDIVSPD